MARGASAGASRVSRHRRWLVIGLALIAYIAVGFAFKQVVLNWIVGPLFPVVVFGLMPRRLVGAPAIEEPAIEPQGSGEVGPGPRPDGSSAS